MLLMMFIGLEGKPVGPILLVKVHEHLLLQFVLAVINDDGVIVAIEAMNECLNGGFVEMPNGGSGLPRFLPQHHELRINETKTVNHDLSLHGLNGIHHQRHRAGIERLEGALGIDVRARQPAPEPGMRMIPPHHHLPPPRLLQHVEHLGLKHGIHRFHGYASPGLRHGEDVHAVDGVVVHELAEHEAHDFHGDACSAVFEHFEEGEGGDVHFFGKVWEGGVVVG